MSATHEEDSTMTLDTDAVRTYLISNPSFVQEDAELFALLANRDPGEGVVDLGAAAREKLLSELRQLKALNEGIVETARANLATQAQVHMAVLALLEADSLAALDRKIAGRVAGALGVDICRVFIEEHAPLRDAEAVLPTAAGFTSDVLGQKVERLGPVQEAHAHALYGPQSARVKSEAIVRLDFQGHDGLLAMAARDPHLLQSGQGTELLNFMARTVERLIIRWLHDR